MATGGSCSIHSISNTGNDFQQPMKLLIPFIAATILLIAGCSKLQPTIVEPVWTWTPGPPGRILFITIDDPDTAWNGTIATTAPDGSDPRVVTRGIPIVEPRGGKMIIQDVSD